jgi:hypothetical protein
MKPQLRNPLNLVQQYEQAKDLLQGSAPPAAAAAHLIQLTAVQNPYADGHGFRGQQSIVTDLIRSSGVDNARQEAVLAVARSVLRASADISEEHHQFTIAAAARHGGVRVTPPTPEVARAFLSRFLEAGTHAGQKGAHNDWFVNLGPGSGNTFCETPSAEAIMKRASEIAQREGTAVTNKHRVDAADQLAKEAKVPFGEAKAAGRLFGLPYETLEKVGGFALEKANANNAASVEAGALGLLAHLSGMDVKIDQSLSPAEYKTALSEKFGDLAAFRAGLSGTEGRSWEQLSRREAEGMIAYAGSLLGELAELRLGHRSYENLSSAPHNALSTIHDVYVQMRADTLFEDAWGKAQAVPFEQLDKKTKDADIPPFFFALHQMVIEAENSMRMSRAS